MAEHTKPSSTYTRSAKHVASYTAKVDERFTRMMSTLKGHKAIREHKSPGQQRDEADKDYFVQRCEKLMQIPKVIGPDEVKYSSNQLRRQQVRNARIAASMNLQRTEQAGVVKVDDLLLEQT